MLSQRSFVLSIFGTVPLSSSQGLERKHRKEGETHAKSQKTKDRFNEVESGNLVQLVRQKNTHTKETEMWVTGG